jgi:hypothetical protein
MNREGSCFSFADLAGVLVELELYCMWTFTYALEISGKYQFLHLRKEGAVCR